MLTGLSLRVSPCALSTQTTSKEEPLEYLPLKRCTVLNHRTANHSGNRIFGNRNRTSICTNQDARIRLQGFEEKMLQSRSRCSRTQSTSRMKSALYWSTTTSEQNRKDAAKEMLPKSRITSTQCGLASLGQESKLESTLDAHIDIHK